jgi:hypothetical protein
MVKRLTLPAPVPVEKIAETELNDSEVTPFDVDADPLVVARNCSVAAIGVPAVPYDVLDEKTIHTGTLAVASVPEGHEPPTLVKWNALFAVLWKNWANVPPPALTGPETAQLSTVAATAAIKSGTRNIFIDVVSFVMTDKARVMVSLA